MTKRYYLGHWHWITEGDDGYFAPPSGVVGLIDLAPVPAQAVAGSARPVGLFVTTAAVLSSDYTLLGEGDCRELNATAAMVSAIQSLVGYRPRGDTLADLIYDVLTDGSDPDGGSAPMPLMPGLNGWCDVRLGGHSRIVSSKFEWGKPCSRGRGHWQKVRSVLRKEFQRLFDDAKAGKLNDAEHHRRVLDFWCDKYRMQGAEDWKEFVPPGLQRDVPGRLKHQTTITESFDTGDSDTLGPDLTWAEVDGDWDIVSNQAEMMTNFGSTARDARAESDLSSADHYAKCTPTQAANSCHTGAAARFASAAETFYWSSRCGTTVFARRLSKVVAGTLTSLANDTTSGADPVECECNGSTIRALYNAVEVFSLTDTSIATGTRCGIAGYDPTGGASSNPRINDFEAADLGGGGAGTLYTQLERDVRGVNRGAYTSWNF